MTLSCVRLINVLIFSVILKKTYSCTDTSSPPVDCIADTTPISLYTNTTVAQKIQFCDITTKRVFTAFRIALNQNASISTADFEFTFNLYKFDEWIAAQCDKNIYEICTPATPIKQFPNISPDISTFGPTQSPYLVIDFDQESFTVNASHSNTAYIWQLHVLDGFEIFDEPSVNFMACDTADETVDYSVYPSKYHNNDTSFMYQFVEACGTNNDNSLTELDPYTVCRYDGSIKPDNPSFDQDVIGLSFKANNDRFFQYFAVTETTTISGINLFMKETRIPNSPIGANINCEFRASLNIYQDSIATGSETVTINGLSDIAKTVPFLFTEPVIITVDGFYKYPHFGIVITEGVTAQCGVSALVCHGQSNMKTWLIEGGQTECRDVYKDAMLNREFSNVDIAFTLVTVSTNPTKNPTFDPTETTYYTSYTTDLMIDGTESVQSSILEFEESKFLIYVIIMLGIIGVLILSFACLCSYVTRSDNFVYSSVVIFVIHSIDVFSDAFFSVSIWTDHALIESDMTFLILAICSLVFIILPLIKNFYDLIQFQTATQNDSLHGDRYRSWLNSYGTILFILALLSGSTFGTMKLMNSNLFGIRMFSMGLCMSHLQQYHSYRMVNVVLMENLPQLVIQIIFSAKVPGKVPLISILSGITSVCSIIVSILDHLSKKELTKQAVPSMLFTFKVTSQTISRKPKQYKNRQNVIRKTISKILILDEMAIEIVNVEEYSDQESDGLVIYVLITTLKYMSTDIYHKLEESFKNGLMDKQMKKAWNMKEKPYCSSLEWLHTSSSAKEQTNSLTLTVKEGETSRNSTQRMDTKHLELAVNHGSVPSNEDVLIGTTPIAHKKMAANVTPSDPNNITFPETE